MRTTIPTDLLLRLMNATPEQFAAVGRILGLAMPSAYGSEIVGAEESPVSEDVAQAAFALLAKLDAQENQKSPSALTVFRLYCAERLSADQIAAKCRCAKGTVMSRLRFIENATHMKPDHFRSRSGHLLKMADDYEGSGAREIYRRGLADGS